MKKWWMLGAAVVLLLVCGVLTSCDSYTGYYWNVYSGNCSTAEFDTVWENRNLTSEQKKDALVALSGSSYTVKNGLTDAALRDYLINTINLAEDSVNKIMEGLNNKPSDLRKIWWDRQPTVRYWCYVIRADLDPSAQ